MVRATVERAEGENTVRCCGDLPTTQLVGWEASMCRSSSCSYVGLSCGMNSTRDTSSENSVKGRQMAGCSVPPVSQVGKLPERGVLCVTAHCLATHTHGGPGCPQQGHPQSWALTIGAGKETCGQWVRWMFNLANLTRFVSSEVTGV